MKLNFNDALERFTDGRAILKDDVLSTALCRKVWIAEWHIPGCISESQSIALTKEDAIQCALDFAGDEPPRGMIANLRRHGQHQHKTELYGTVVTTISPTTLGDLL